MIAAYETAMKGADYANLGIVDTVYGNDDAQTSYEQDNALLDKYPDPGLIMSPTSVGIVAAAKADRRGRLRRRQDLRPGPALGDARLLPGVRLRPRVHPLELRRPGLPHLLHCT
ncbi:MAG: hypothetical protein U0667_04130 [Chloroflexota bacterium]